MTYKKLDITIIYIGCTLNKFFDLKVVKFALPRRKKYKFAYFKEDLRILIVVSVYETNFVRGGLINV